MASVCNQRAIAVKRATPAELGDRGSNFFDCFRPPYAAVDETFVVLREGGIQLLQLPQARIREIELVDQYDSPLVVRSFDRSDGIVVEAFRAVKNCDDQFGITDCTAGSRDALRFNWVTRCAQTRGIE